MTQYTVKLNW